MSLTIEISGVYRDPEAQPLPGVTLVFETLYNSSQTQLQMTVKTITDEEAAYKIGLVPDVYTVTEVNAGRKKWLGNIQIFADSAPGTLNEYLTSFQADQVRPGILAEMEEILEETKEVAAGAGVVPCGPYQPDTAYEVNDLVEWGGSEYRATAEVYGIAPPDAPWELFLAKGNDGEDGEAGPPNVLEIGQVVTLEPGEPARADITGDSPNQTLNLAIPAGKNGEDGGDGKDGEPGPANTLTIGTVLTVDYGQPAAAEITGEAPDQTLNLTIPAGPQGPIFIPDAWDGPGAVVFAYYDVETGEEYHGPGEEVPASMVYVGEIVFKTSAEGEQSSNPSWGKHPSGGTWRLQGNTTPGTDANYHDVKSCLVFQRIDGVTPSMQEPTLQLLAAATEQVRNCRYSSSDNHTIDCEIYTNGKWHPFTASPDDPTSWGPYIYQNAVAGQYGPVAAYV